MSFTADNLQPSPGATHAKKRVGRGNGSGHGTYATRGLKGQKSRSGKKLPYDNFEGGQFPYARKFHTLRGFNNKWRVPYQAVNVEALDRFDDGTVVTPELLKAVGLLRHLREPVKLLADGELSKRLDVRVHAYSQAAAAKITAAGGTVSQLAEPAAED
ncbi:MAG: 50S ribosomal protein L15 [Dehalococcoidia bacterium]